MALISVDLQENVVELWGSFYTVRFPGLASVAGTVLLAPTQTSVLLLSFAFLSEQSRFFPLSSLT